MGDKIMGFSNISIIGRAAYCIYSLEIYFKENGYNLDEFKLLFDTLWSFSEMEYVDEYAYKIIEYNPETIFDENEEFEYLDVDELLIMKNLYMKMHSKDLSVVTFMLDGIYNLMSSHLYTGNTAPATHSLDVINDELLPFIQKKIKKYPDAEMFEIYNINDNSCWGTFYSRQHLLQDKKD